MSASRPRDSRRARLPDAGRVGAAPRHLAVSWPHKEASWPGKFDPVPGDLRRDGARSSPTGEEVHINVAGPGDGGGGRARLLADAGAAAGNVFFHHNPTNDAWCRDHGPIFVQRDRRRTARAGDRRLGLQRLGRQVPAVRPRRRRSRPASARSSACRCSTRASCWRAARIDVNGARHAAHHRGLPAQPQPQPGASTAREIEQLPAATTSACAKILWLGDGIVGDDTDGHVDDLTRFVDARTVVTVVEDDPADENYEPLQANLERLRGDDRPGRPAAPGRDAADAAPARTTTASACRRATPTSTSPTAWCSCPTYDPRARRDRARPRCRNSSPPATWSAIDCTDLVWGLGAFHCVTQQWPALS